MNTTAFRYDAFLSYSRSDIVFAKALQRALNAYVVPKGVESPHRRLLVFRDESDLRGTEYHAAIAKYLKISRKMIVVCSPASRLSTYVNDEITLFVADRGATDIIPILLHGLPNNELTPETAAEAAFPGTLSQAGRMPLAKDFRGCDPRRDKVNKRAFEKSWYSLLAELLDLEPGEIEQREKKRQTRVLRQWLTAAAALVVVLAVLSAWALHERDQAQQQRDQALRSQSVFMAQQSREQTTLGRTDLAIRLALQALPAQLHRPDRPWTWSAESALYRAVAQGTFRHTSGTSMGVNDTRLQSVSMTSDSLRAALNYGARTELWDLEFGERIATFNPDEHASVTQVTFSPEDRFLAIAYNTQGTVIYGGYGDITRNRREQTVRGSKVDIIDAKSGRLVTAFQVPGHVSNYIKFSPNGDLLFVATDETASFFQTTDWTPLAHSDWDPSADAAFRPPYATVAFSEDQDRVAIVTKAHFVGLMDRSDKSIGAVYQGQQEIRALRLVGRKGERLLLGTGESVMLFANESPSGARLSMRNPALVLAVGSSPDGTIVAVTSDCRTHSWRDGKETTDDPMVCQLRSAYLDRGATAAIVALMSGEVQFWDLKSRIRTVVLPPSANRYLMDAQFDRTGRTVLVASSDGRARLWSPGLPIIIGRAVATGRASATAASVRPQTHHVAIGYQDGSIAIADPTANRVVWQAAGAHGGGLRYLAFDRNGDRLISASADGTAKVWTIDGKMPPLTLAGHTKAVDFGAFSPDGRIIVTGSSDSTFRLYDSGSGAFRRALALPEQYRDPIFDASINAHAAFTSDGTTLVTVTSGDGEAISQPALVWDVGSGALRHALPHSAGAIWHMAITDDDKYVVTASFDESAALWDIRTGQRAKGPLRHPAPVIKGIVYNEGRFIATASRDGTLRIWSADSGRLLHDVRVTAASQTASGEVPVTLVDLVVSHNGRFLATAASAERHTEISIWDSVEGTQSAVMRASGEPPSLTGLAFTDDDRALLTRSRGGALTVWSLPPSGQPLIDLARGLIRTTAQGLLSTEQRVRFGLQEP